MPDMSVTIVPTGEAYRVAQEVISALSRQCPTHNCSGFEPHVTLQYVYDAPDPKAVLAVVQRCVASVAPVDVRFGGLGLFEPCKGVHVRLQATPELVDLYVAVKAALDAAGFKTYPYDAGNWQPHLTLSCGHWSPDELALIREMFGRFDESFVAARVQVNVLEPTGWVTLRDLPLGDGERLSSAA